MNTDEELKRIPGIIDAIGAVNLRTRASTGEQWIHVILPTMAEGDYCRAVEGKVIEAKAWLKTNGYAYSRQLQCWEKKVGQG